MPLIKRISCIIGTAGHIDHGKTSLVKALTGIDTDRLIEEKKRGVSIDLGFAYMDFNDGLQSVENSGVKSWRAAIVDVPGHERFIKNMLAGVTGIDIVLFAVAADDGIMPQTREHLDIIHLLGVKKGIFVITKSDLVESSRLAEVKKDVELLIEDTLLKGSPIIPVSVVTGSGIPDLKELIRVNVIKSRRFSREGFFRLPVDRSFPVKGFGTVVTGTVASGSIGKGGEAIVFPAGSMVKVRGIQSLYLEADEVSAGERAALNLANISYGEIHRGFVIAAPELSLFAEKSRQRKHFNVDCFFEFLSRGSGKGRPQVKNKALLKVHHLTDETLATIQLSGAKGPNGSVSGRLILKKPLLMLKGDRFILRDPSINSTIGGGVVALPYLSGKLLQRFEKTKFPSSFESRIEETLGNLLPEKGVGFDSMELSLMLNTRIDALKGLITKNGGIGPEYGFTGEFIVNLKRFDALKNKIKDILTKYHKDHPMEAGVKEEELFKAIKSEITPLLTEQKSEALFKEILEGLLISEPVKREGPVLRLASHRAKAGGNELIIENKIMELLSEGGRGGGGFTSLNAADIMNLPFKKEDVARVLQYLQRNGAVVKLKEGSFISRANLDSAKEKLTDYIKAKGSIRASEFRDILGCGRKLAIEALEYFDKEKVTLRQGDMRTLR